MTKPGVDAQNGPAAGPAALLREMFERTVIPKNAALFDDYYHPDFELTTNGIMQRFPEYKAAHVGVYETPIRYSIRYDEDTWVETADRVAVRMWITTERPGESPTELELVLIATLLDGKLHRLWELTWPDWSRLDAFEQYPGVPGPA